MILRYLAYADVFTFSKCLLRHDKTEEREALNDVERVLCRSVC